jgi:large subunit ribosomal protein L6
MSRIGKKPIPVPSGVDVAVADGVLNVKGPKGALSLPLHSNVIVKNEDSVLTIEVANPEEKGDRALWGLFRSLVANMVTGVTTGFERRLEIAGVGYRAAVNGNKVVLNVGFSHPVELTVPEGLTVAVDKNTIIVSGFDKHTVGQFAAIIRDQKPPEPYKGKGIRYSDEIIRRKAGKAAKAVGG